MTEQTADEFVTISITNPIIALPQDDKCLNTTPDAYDPNTYAYMTTFAYDDHNYELHFDIYKSNYTVVIDGNIQYNCLIELVPDSKSFNLLKIILESGYILIPFNAEIKSFLTKCMQHCYHKKIPNAIINLNL